MGKVIIPDDEVWAWNGSILKPNPEHFEEGHTTGATGKKPRHDQFNYMEQRRDLNLQYLLRMAGLPYDPLEVYPVNARASKNGHMYVSLENNNKGNDPISSGKWKHEDDDKFPVGTVIFDAVDNGNPATYKGFGVWELVEAQTTINMTTAEDENLGTVTGSNNKSVPVPLHNHTVTINSTNLGSKNTNTTGNHSHTYKEMYLTGAVQGGGGTYNKSVRTSNTSTAGNHYHTVSLGSHSHSGSVANAGETDASINVQSKAINVLGWLRTE